MNTPRFVTRTIEETNRAAVRQAVGAILHGRRLQMEQQMKRGAQVARMVEASERQMQAK